MKEYIYPALFHQNDDNSYTVTFPDLPGCITEGDSMADALKMAQSALSQWIEYLIDKKEAIPAASNPADMVTDKDEFVSLIGADVRDTRAVRRTVSIPHWMDEEVSASGLSLSRVLQEAISAKLKLG